MSNTSTAVMAQRSNPKDDLDYFPTPPWATRALAEYVLDKVWIRGQYCLEPACGAGHMAKPLKEYFSHVRSTDIKDYGYGDGVLNFLTEPCAGADWVITNPPFKHAESFIHRGLDVAWSGVAVLVRTSFLESIGRHARLFSLRPPTTIAIFSERVPMVKERLNKDASSATSYSWLVWDFSRVSGCAPHFRWIPPCRKQLERDSDYD